MELLGPLKARYPDVSYADLYTLAGKVAIESAGGPQISWREPTPVPPRYARTTERLPPMPAVWCSHPAARRRCWAGR